jgi:hypothetical protein
MLYEHWQEFDAAGYSGLVVDLYGFDDELRAQRNAARPERTRVNEAAVERMKAQAASIEIPGIMRENSKVKFLNARNDEEVQDVLKEIRKILKDPRCERDLSHYDRVVHIGDLQGCFDPIKAEGSPLKNGLDPNCFYVFLGDLFDRGPQNGEVGKWFMQEVYGRPNVAFIAGNHEDYVDKQARSGVRPIGLPDSEWERFSWPQLKLAGLNHRDIRRMSNMSQDYLSYTWRGKQVLCSHAGFPRRPSRMELVSQKQLRRGSGHYGLDVDQMWNEAEKDSGCFQIHGHRNANMSPIVSTDLSMNLEGQVEFGGHMRFVTLDEHGFEPTEIRSTTYRTMQQDIKLNHQVNRSPSSSHAPIMPWAHEHTPLPQVSSELIRRMNDHDMIQIKKSASLPGVFSVNFTHKAFKNAAWDDYTTVARGLYIDGERRTIVARSYEKFFNLNERPETRADTIAGRMVYPVHAYEKANGFLCITGYSERHGELVVASKSVTDGEFPDIANDVLSKELGPDGMERLLRFNRDQQASLVFEIEDPERDPHIIKIDKPKVTLLACIRRSETFEQAPYADLQKLAQWIGCDVKKHVATLPNERALESFNRRVEQQKNWGPKGRPVEGCVMEDQSGQFYKLKSYYYRNWKRMRSAAGYMRKAKLNGNDVNLDRYLDMPEEFREFLGWASALSAKALELDIITLRDAFEGDRAEVEAIKDDILPEEVKQAERASNFRSVIESIAANDKISDESLTRFVKSALENSEKAEVLKNHPLGKELIGRVEEVESTSMSAPGF